MPRQLGPTASVGSSAPACGRRPPSRALSFRRRPGRSARAFGRAGSAGRGWVRELPRRTDAEGSSPCSSSVGARSGDPTLCFEVTTYLRSPIFRTRSPTSPVASFASAARCSSCTVACTSPCPRAARPGLRICLSRLLPSWPSASRSILPLRNRVALNIFNVEVWKPTLAAAGVIPMREKGGRWQISRKDGFHVLRHTYASIVLGAGESVVTLARWLGHSSPTITLSHYAHFRVQLSLHPLPHAGEWRSTRGRVARTLLRRSTRSALVLTPITQSQSRRLKMTYKPVHTTAIRTMAKG